jgi:hypothetical protein
VVFGSVMLGCQTKLLHFDAPVDPMLLFAPGITRRPVALRALIDLLRTFRGSTSAKGALQNPFAAE